MAERRAMIVVYVFVSMVRISLETDGVPVGTGEKFTRMVIHVFGCGSLNCI